jgi:hypothetical protein
MLTKFPVDFKSKVQDGSDISISANDLMLNFSAAFIEIDPTLISDTVSPTGHTQRRLLLPGVPPSGTVLLGAVDGALQWIQTEECA